MAQDLRPGDFFVKRGHVVMFLYYANAAKTTVMIIEQGGASNLNTVTCRVKPISYYTDSGVYIARRKASFA